MRIESGNTLCGKQYDDRFYAPGKWECRVCWRCAERHAEIVKKKVYAAPAVRKFKYKAFKRSYGRKLADEMWNAAVKKRYEVLMREWNKQARDFQRHIRELNFRAK